MGLENIFKAFCSTDRHILEAAQRQKDLLDFSLGKKVVPQDVLKQILSTPVNSILGDSPAPSVVHRVPNIARTFSPPVIPKPHLPIKSLLENIKTPVKMAEPSFFQNASSFAVKTPSNLSSQIVPPKVDNPLNAWQKFNQSTKAFASRAYSEIGGKVRNLPGANQAKAFLESTGNRISPIFNKAQGSLKPVQRIMAKASALAIKTAQDPRLKLFVIAAIVFAALFPHEEKTLNNVSVALLATDTRKWYRIIVGKEGSERTINLQIESGKPICYEIPNTDASNMPKTDPSTKMRFDPIQSIANVLTSKEEYVEKNMYVIIVDDPLHSLQPEIDLFQLSENEIVRVIHRRGDSDKLDTVSGIFAPIDGEVMDEGSPTDWDHFNPMEIPFHEDQEDESIEVLHHTFSPTQNRKSSIKYIRIEREYV